MSIAPDTLREPGRRSSVRTKPSESELRCDVCVVGAGAAGVSAAVEARRLGLRVCLLDGLPQIGGQSVNGMVGTLCGFFSAGPAPVQLDYGFAADVLVALQSAGAIAYRRGRNTVIGLYDEHELAAVYARSLRAAGVDVVLGALLCDVRRGARRIDALRVQTRFGALSVRADTFIDASGDAALATWAGLPVREADGPVYGTCMFSITALGSPVPERARVVERLHERGARYGLDRLDGFVFEFPGRDVCLVNLTHFETPLDALQMSRVALDARSSIDRVMAFLRAEFVEGFGRARVLAVGQPGVRQTRSITARSTLSTAAVRAGVRPDDAIARCAWPIEFHGRAEGVHWETFDDGHLSWVPLSSLIADGVCNLVAAGRCIDAEPFALSAVRVIGPCMAMGRAAAAAAHVGRGELHDLDGRAVVAAVGDNVDRCDPGPAV